MEVKFQKVTPDGFDVDALLKASRDGNLFISVEKNITPEEMKNEVIAYICKIEAYVRPQYAVHYIQLWQEILAHSKFPLDYFLYKKGNNKGGMNKRSVFTIVRYLNEDCKVYVQRSAFLARLLEGVKGKPSIYTSSSNNSSYALTMEQMLAVDQIVSQYKNC